ncbi:MAG: ferredoxin reductase family protein [Aquiluna sp.]|nr:ferredoxin reductase family protein [Aquiluna sp.]MCF8545797.1 ferredoxin reductase family protein [Aquiluna sp.]
MTTQKPGVVILGTGKLLSLQRKTDFVQVLAIAGVLIPVLFFLANGGLAKANDIASWLDVVNRLTALIGTSLLLVHMILIARVPWLERILGLDKLTHAHKKLGKPILYLFVGHAVAAVLSYSISDQTDVAQTFFHLVIDFSDLLFATLGLLLMVAVVVSSINAARRNLSYEAWYLIHLLSYLSIFLAIPHQFSLGTELLAQPMLMGYYIALYVFVGANILWFRFLVPIVASVRLGLKVVSVKPEANKTTSIEIGGKNIYRLGAEAGQFFMLRVLTRKQWWRPHPFSISSDPVNSIRFTVGNRGDDTALLQEIKVGTRVILEGPFGVFSESKRTKQHVLLLAAGIGVAPIRALAESLAAEPGDVTIVYRVTDRSDAALIEELERISESKGHVLHVLGGPRPEGEGFLPKQLEDEPAKPEYARFIELAPFVAESDIYICGPTSWSQAAMASLKKLQIEKTSIHLEEFAW